MKLHLKRTYLDNCTIGVLTCGSFSCKTLELPDKQNKVRVSCIPEGTYKLAIIKSPSLGWCIDIPNVKGRTYIRIHAGNYTRQILGCILVGRTHADIDNDGITDVTTSKNTLKELMELIEDQADVELVIE